MSIIFANYVIFTTIILTFIIVGVVSFKIFYGASHDKNKFSCLPQSNVSTISTTNYTNVLKAVHDNIDSYVGLKINFVGFLTEFERAQDFKDNTWVDVTGEITKGNYHGDMPIVKVIEMKETSAPNEEYVYPPDESYIPTDGVL